MRAKNHDVPFTGGPRLWTLRLPPRRGALLLLSDTHEDSPQCRRDLLDATLATAVERGAVTLHFGDLFDAMGGLLDRRRAEWRIRPEDKRDDYFDAIVANMVARRAAWPLDGLFGLGNHEASVLHHQQVDLLARFCAEYSRVTGRQAVRAGYDGYVRVYLGDAGPLLLYWHHGAGGAAPVTRGVIRTARRAVYLTDPDVVVSGHIHHAWAVPIARETVTAQGVARRLQWHIQCPGYKATDGIDWGYEKKHELAPTPLGCWWLELAADGRRLRVSPVADFH